MATWKTNVLQWKGNYEMRARLVLFFGQYVRHILPLDCYFEGQESMERTPTWKKS